MGTIVVYLSRDDENFSDLPQVSCVKFKDALNIAAGTSTGHVRRHEKKSIFVLKIILK